MQRQPIRARIVDERLRELGLPMPATELAAGLDLRACLDRALTLAPGQCELIGSGIALDFADSGLAALIIPRSGMGHKRGLILGNSTGLVDADYTGELKISLWNRGAEAQIIEPLERIAQLMFVPVVHARLIETEAVTQTARGEGGFGHTASH